MILTVTVNPAVDQTVWLERLIVGAVNRPTQVQLDPAGKGINVSRMVRRLGVPTIAFGFLAGDTGHIVEQALDAERVQHHFIRIPGQTRVNVTINDRTNGSATSLFEPGPAIDNEALARFEEALGVWLPVCRVLVLAGSLLPGMPDDWYRRIVDSARSLAVRVIVDADGEPARHALRARPYLIKPNRTEAERLLGRSLPDIDAVLEGARELTGSAEVVVISLGAAGAVCVTREQGWRIRAPAIAHLSAVGSGDSLVAGIGVALARGEGIEAGLRLGTAAGAATAMSEGTRLGTIDEVAQLVPQVIVEPA